MIIIRIMLRLIIYYNTTSYDIIARHTIGMGRSRSEADMSPGSTMSQPLGGPYIYIYIYIYAYIYIYICIHIIRVTCDYTIHTCLFSTISQPLGGPRALLCSHGF